MSEGGRKEKWIVKDDKIRRRGRGGGVMVSGAPIHST